MHRLTVIATLLLVVFLFTAVPSATGHAEPQNPPTRIYLPLLTRQVPPPFGYGLEVNPSGNAGANTGHVRALGFGWAKAQVQWDSVEPKQGEYSWGNLDAFVSAYRAAGVKVLVTVKGTPAWARPAGADLVYDGPPADNATLANFLHELSLRYKGQVQAIEVWSEQNVMWSGGGTPIPPGSYVAMLRAAYEAIKSVDSSIVVVSGAPVPTGLNDGKNAIDDVVYIGQMYAAGLKGTCDAVGAHAQGYNNPPDATYGYADPTEPTYKAHRAFFFRGTMEAYRAAMVQYGDSATKIWATEVGWASDPVGQPGYEFARDNTLGEQASFNVQAYQMAKAWGWVGAMFLWNLDYGVTRPTSAVSYWSLLRPDPVPAYGALAAMPK